MSISDGQRLCSCEERVCLFVCMCVRERKREKICVCVHKRVIKCVCICPTPQTLEGCDTMPVFERSTACLNSRLVAYNFSLPYYLLTAWEEFMPFQEH